MRKASFQMDFDLRWKTIFICSVTVHTRVPSNGILPMLRIPNRQNLLPELYRTEFSVQKIPICEQLPYYSLHSSDLNQSLYFS